MWLIYQNPMNRILILIFLLTITQVSWAQDCDFEIRNLSDTLNGKSELIDKSEYDKVAIISEEFIDFKPKSEIEFTEKYPKIFKLKDSCYSFKTNLGDEIGILKICKNKVQSKEYSNYEFRGIYCGNALIKIEGYESWGFISVNLDNGFSCFTMGKPLTSNGETAISYSNYYGEEEIALTDLKTKEQYVIGIENYRTIESIVNNNVYYLKLESEYTTECKKKNKYLRIKIKN